MSRVMSDRDVIGVCQPLSPPPFAQLISNVITKEVGMVRSRVVALTTEMCGRRGDIDEVGQQ